MATTVTTFEKTAIVESEAKFLLTPLRDDGDRKEEKRKKKSLCSHEHKSELIGYDALPDFLKHNEFILDYYRSEWPLKEAFLSIFSIHNETLNVWTHLIGFFLFLSLAILTATMVPTSASATNNPQLLITNDGSNSTFTRHNYYNGLTAATVLRTAAAAADAADHAVKTTTTNASARWPFYAYMGGAMFCLLMSSACHLLSCHSARACYVLLRLDYAGIAALIVTSFYPLVYYSFACDPLARSVYVGIITAVGAAVVVVSLTPAFERPRLRHARAALFACMGLSGLVPILHKVAVYGDRPEAMAATAYEMGMGACYAVGVAVYAARVPERWMPGMFDIAGHSHQLFHVLVIAGAYFHYLAGLVYLRWRDVDGCLL